MSNRFIIISAVILLTTLLIGSGSCNCDDPCLPEPESDSTPPSAGALVAYYRNNIEETVSVSSQDPPVEVYADSNSNINIIYSGQDNEGMRRVSLGASGTWYPNPNTIQHGTFQFDPLTSSCPVKLLMGSETLVANGKPGKIQITVESENWVGLTTSTRFITVRFGE